MLVRVLYDDSYLISRKDAAADCTMSLVERTLAVKFQLVEAVCAPPIRAWAVERGQVIGRGEDAVSVANRAPGDIARIDRAY